MVDSTQALLKAEEAPKHWESQDLLDGGKEAVIVHLGQEYRLRATKNGKLILTK